MHSQPLICVHDVEAMSRWYQQLLGCESAHGGPQYERLVRDGVLVLQLHNWDVEHDHGPIGDPQARPYGNGLLLWFEVDDFHAAVSRARALNAEILRPAFHHVGASQWECWMRDPEGYKVVISSPDSKVG
jgi:predicted enzyme related to lactoylglutathione lyase